MICRAAPPCAAWLRGGSAWPFRSRRGAAPDRCHAPTLPPAELLNEDERPLCCAVCSVRLARAQATLRHRRRREYQRARSCTDLAENSSWAKLCDLSDCSSACALHNCGVSTPRILTVYQDVRILTLHQDLRMHACRTQALGTNDSVVQYSCLYAAFYAWACAQLRVVLETQIRIAAATTQA
jgi:hypothetical protein